MAMIPDSLKESIQSKFSFGGDKKDTSPAPEKSIKEFQIAAKIIAKNFMSLPGIARDLNVARQNVQQLVKIMGGEAATGADEEFLRAAKREEKVAVESEEERAKDLEFFKQQQKEEAKAPTQVITQEKLEEENKPSSIFDKLKKYLALGALVTLFVMTFWEDLVAKVKEWANNLWTTIKEKFTEFVEYIKNWFNETVQPIIDNVKEVFGKIIEKISAFFTSVGEWVAEKFAKIKEFFEPVVEFIKGVFDKFMGVVNTVKEGFQKFKDFIKPYIENALDTPIVKYLPPVLALKALTGAKSPEEKKEEKPKPVPVTPGYEEEVAVEEMISGVQVPREEAAPPTPPPEVKPPAAPPPKPERKRERVSKPPKLPPPKPAPTPAPTPAPAPAPAPAAPPAAAPTAAAPKPPPSPSDSKPVKISSETGKKAMIKAMDDNKVTDPTARAAIMAQVGHESGGFKVLSENLNYRPATLLKIFPRYFKSKEEAERTAAAGPKAIADKVYGGRMGNAPDEGFLYRGRGFIQLTGKNNYKKFGYASNPDAVASPEAGADTAMKYMLGYKGDWGDIKKVTKFVNGGTIGLEDRAKHFQEYLNDPEITKVGAVSTTTSGGAIASTSADLAAGQRAQQKPSTPIVINSPKTTNTVVQNNVPPVIAKSKTDAGKTLMNRVT